MLQLCLDPDECFVAVVAVKQASNCDRLPVKGKITAVAECSSTSHTICSRYVLAQMTTVLTQDFY